MKADIPNPTFPTALSFDDVLLVPQNSDIKSRSQVDLSTKISPKLTLEIPLGSTNMDTVTGVEMAIEMSRFGGFGVLPRFTAPETQADQVAKVKLANALAAASVGCKKGEIERAEKLANAGVDILNLDVAHGHMTQAVDMTKTLRQKFPRLTIISGIAATAEAAEAHFLAGADAVTLGIGGGSICTTRIQTGCGLPTLASILAAAKIARKHDKALIPLAGLRNSGDIVKALAAGASMIWAGSLFAGTDEAPGEIVEIKGKKYKAYNGSTSAAEKQKQIEINPQGKSAAYVKHIEGVEAFVEYKGPVENVVSGLLAGVRSGFSYCGAKSLEELWQRARFVQITPGGIRENGAHDVTLA